MVLSLVTQSKRVHSSREKRVSLVRSVRRRLRHSADKQGREIANSQETKKKERKGAA